MNQAQNPQTANETEAPVAAETATPGAAPQLIAVTPEQLGAVVASVIAAAKTGLAGSDAQQAPAGTTFSKNRASQSEAEKFFEDHPSEMTLDNLINAELPIYIKNNVSVAAQISIDFVISGKRKTVVVPNTWMPICLNDVMSGSDIASCGSLRNHLRKGSVILLHPKKARDLLNTERGQRELNKYRSQYANSEAVAALNIPNTSEEAGDRMQALMASYKEASTPEARQSILDEVYNNVRTFSIADLNFFRGMTAGNPVAEKQFIEMVEEVNAMQDSMRNQG